MSKERDLILPGLAGAARGGVWAVIGTGKGELTLALQALLGPEVEIYSVERDAGVLARQRRAVGAAHPDAHIHYIEADFTQPLDLPQLDGMLLANALHRVPFEQQEWVLARLCKHLKPGGRLILIEYERQQGTLWARYPVSYEAFENLATAAGLRDVRRLAAIPASFFRDVYSALGERA
jgi:ubiquinone/menaquinone biosynthesis C-methylase UbiE